MQRIDELKTTPIVGEIYLVPCIFVNYTEDIRHPFYKDDGEYYYEIAKIKVKSVFPIINHLHNDKENGQKYQHYHVDFRFIPNDRIVQIKQSFYKVPDIRYNLNHRNNKFFDPNYQIEYVALKCLSLEHRGITQPSAVSQTKFKHECIYKGKCPHRGYELSQEQSKNGIITCPLHGLKFNAETSQKIHNQSIKIYRGFVIKGYVWMDYANPFLYIDEQNFQNKLEIRQKATTNLAVMERYIDRIIHNKKFGFNLKEPDYTNCY